ncbi:hypothetical protein J3U18_05350 [Gilliamella sp. B3482]|nr:hypothetical protein [Gilliamella sp. B3482]
MLIPFYSSYALTSKTSNLIHGNAPYLTFDGGRTRAVNTDALLGITLSDGTKYTPSTNTSSTTPIVLPVTGQSFADIGMLVPTNTDSVALNELIGSPYNYWGDDDGDTDVTVTGSLSLSIVDKNNQPVSRNAIPEICKSPYQIKLTTTNGTLTTRYGIPSSSSFNANNATYYINPNASAEVCFAKPSLNWNTDNYVGPPSIFDRKNGFLTQSVTPASYDLNFPTTGLHGLEFDLLISGNNQALSWSRVALGGVVVSMTNSTPTSVHVTLSGPVATLSQKNSSNPGNIPRPALPKTFELVGRDSNGNAVVKYGFTLKQWFVNRGDYQGTYNSNLSWCNHIGYRMPRVKDLTNATCQGFNSGEFCRGLVGAIPSSSHNTYQRRIGAGFFTEWGKMDDYSGAGFTYYNYKTSDLNLNGNAYFYVSASNGYVNYRDSNYNPGLCVSVDR